MSVVQLPSPDEREWQATLAVVANSLKNIGVRDPAIAWVLSELKQRVIEKMPPPDGAIEQLSRLAIEAPEEVRELVRRAAKEVSEHHHRAASVFIFAIVVALLELYYHPAPLNETSAEEIKAQISGARDEPPQT
jgi:hypothetical protein